MSKNYTPNFQYSFYNTSRYPFKIPAYP